MLQNLQITNREGYAGGFDLITDNILEFIDYIFDEVYAMLEKYFDRNQNAWSGWSMVIVRHTLGFFEWITSSLRHEPCLQQAESVKKFAIL